MAVKRPFSPGAPVRKVVHRGAARTNGRFASRKMGRMIPWESFIEKDFILLAEVDPVVLAVHAQPLTVEFHLEGKRHSYTPDFLVETAKGREIHEVKPDDAAEDPDLLRRLGAAAAEFREMGYAFSLTTESAIRKPVVLQNAALLGRSVHHPLEQDDVLFLQDLMDTIRFTSIEHLCSGRFGRVLDIGQVHRLLIEGTLSTDMTTPLSPRSMVWVGDVPQRLLPLLPLEEC